MNIIYYYLFQESEPGSPVSIVEKKEDSHDLIDTQKEHSSQNTESQTLLNSVDSSDDQINSIMNDLHNLQFENENKVKLEVEVEVEFQSVGILPLSELTNLQCEPHVEVEVEVEFQSVGILLPSGLTNLECEPHVEVEVATNVQATALCVELSDVRCVNALIVLNIENIHSFSPSVSFSFSLFLLFSL